MNDPKHNAPARHLEPRVDDRRFARQWQEIGRRFDRRGPRRTYAAALALAAALTVVFAVVLWKRHDAPRMADHLEGVSFEALAAGETVALPDGTRLVLGADSRITLASVRKDDVRIELERGVVDLDVTHVDGRRFAVVAARHEIEVVGTVFQVRRSDVPGRPSLEVHVTRGRVRVRATREDGGVHELGDGETWSTMAAAPAAADLPPVPATPEPSATAAPLPRAAPTPGRQESPKELLARAEAAQAEGRMQDAATAFNELRRTRRSDPRAALAAFELGRIRLDFLGDPTGAAEALGDAIALSPSAPFREDAEARRVAAFAAMGSVQKCRDAKAAYFSRYPQGVHRAELQGLCP